MIEAKVESMLSNKKEQAKGYNNNPPKRDFYQSLNKSEMRKERSVSPTDEYQIKKTYEKSDVSCFGAADTKIKQLQVRMQEMEQQQLEMVKQNNTLKAELRRSADTIPAKKCQAIEEMLVNLANDVMDNQKEFIQVLKKHGESDG